MKYHGFVLKMVENDLTEVGALTGAKYDKYNDCFKVVINEMEYAFNVNDMISFHNKITDSLVVHMESEKNNLNLEGEL